MDIMHISDQIKIQLKINNKRKIGKFKIFWELNNQLIKEEAIREVIRHLKRMKTMIQHTKTYRKQSSTKGKMYRCK